MSLTSLAARDNPNSLCTPHSVIITAFWKYNLIAICLSLASKLTSYFLLRRRRPLSPGRASLSITGSVALAILGAYLTGVVIERSCPLSFRCPAAGFGLVVWATRPRATAGVFLVNLPFALWRNHRERVSANPVVAPVAYNGAGNYSLVRLNPDGSSLVGEGDGGKGLHSWGENPAVYNPQYYQDRDSSAKQQLSPDVVAAALAPRRTERENLFLKTCMTTSLAEFFICFIGVPIYFLPAIENTSPYQPNPKINRFECRFRIPSMYDERSAERHYTLCSPDANSVMATAAIGMLAGFVLFGLAVVIVAAVSCAKRTRREEGYCLPVWLVAWVPLVVATVFTWIMWLTFLNDTGYDGYCVGNMGQVDAVNIVQIVVLNLWRQLV